MYPLKQSTALTVPIFAHDVNGDGVTGLVDGGFTKRISKNGGAFAAMTVTITEMENGWYSLPLDAGHTDTLGLLTVSISHASAKRINLQFRVSARLVDDLATSTALATVQSDTDDIQTRLPAALVGGRMDSSVGAMAANVVTAAAIATDAIDGDAIAATAVTEIQAGLATSAAVSTLQTDTDDIQTRLPAALVGGRMASNAEVVGDKTGYALTAGEEDAIVNKVWDELTAEARAVGSYGQLVKDDINAAISSRATPAQILATPANLLATDATGRVTVGTNADKTGYAIGNGGIAAVSFAAGAIDSAAVNATAGQKIGDEVLKRDMSAVTGEAVRSPLNALRVLRNKRSIAAGVLTITKEDDATAAWTADVVTAAGNPITSVDPV